MDLPQFHLHETLEQKHWWFTARRTLLLSLLQELLPASKDHLVLDVGCGTGGNTAAISTAYSCIGIDPVSEAIASAKKRFPTITFRTGYAPNDLPEISSADAVLLLDVLEHVEEDAALVSSLISEMKPHALLILAAPADPTLWSIHDAGFNHIRRYTPDSFRALWNNEPVSTLLCTHWNTTLYPLIRIIRSIERRIGRSLGDADTDLSLPPMWINTLLQYILKRENTRILAALNKQKAPYTYGVSLLGVVRKNELTPSH